MAKRGPKKKHSLFPKLKLKQETIQSIFFIFFLVLAIISVFSFLQTGPIPTRYNEILVKYFGFCSVLVPFLLVLTAFLFTKAKVPFREPNVFFGFLIMFISLIGLSKQGTIGLFFWNYLISLFGQVPTVLLFVFLGIVGFVILFDTSIIQVFKFFATVATLIKKYTFGATKKAIKASKNAKEAVYKSDFLSQHKEEKDKTDQNLVNIPPVFKPVVPAAAASMSPTSSTSSSSNQIWEYPPVTLFDNTPGAKADRGDTRKNAQIIEQTLDSFGITARVVDVSESPSVTQYAIEVALGTKLAKIVSLANDLAMALAAPGGQIRVEAPIPGRSLVGIEVPNKSLQVVPIRQIFESDIMKQAKSKITVPLGLDVTGHAKVADVAKMPHVLIAGQTGSGKSVCVNSWICSILFRASPDEVKMIMVDPKRVELTPYNGIPHLLNPVITDPEKVVSALKWACGEMDRRYKLLTEVGAKNIDDYNNKAGFQSLPFILIIIDEMAEVMMFSPSEVEESICRIAQMARAVGIHLILATQRPSVNIITGLIKANIPTRTAFAVSSMMDSRVILDSPGAEKLLGRGDMLYIPPELAKPVRIQGCFISDHDRDQLVAFVKNQRSPDYDEQVTSQAVASHNTGSKNIMSVDGEDRDSKFDEAIKAIQESGQASSSFLQRRLKLGYARAARLIDQLEQAGIIGPSKSNNKARDILIQHNSADNGEM